MSLLASLLTVLLYACSPAPAITDSVSEGVDAVECYPIDISAPGHPPWVVMVSTETADGLCPWSPNAE